MKKKLEELMDLYETLKREVRRNAPHEYERWKAGGFLIDNDIVSMYPTLQEVIEGMATDDDDEDDDE